MIESTTVSRTEKKMKRISGGGRKLIISVLKSASA